MPGEEENAHFEGEESHTGGAAPEHRRCRYTKADGKGCRDWAVRGQDFCYRHGVFLHAGGRRGQIDVPLLEDESSIVLVLSETLRALALGAIPVNNGRLILDGCRLAHTIHVEKQKAAQAERRLQRTREIEQEAGREKGVAKLEPEPEQEAGREKAEAELELEPEPNAPSTLHPVPSPLHAVPCGPRPVPGEEEALELMEEEMAAAAL